MSINTFRLVTLGRLDLLNASGAQADPSLSARRRKIALLVVLASVRRPVSKDALVEMFWGEQDEARARHSLSDALSHLRRVLGRSSIVANQATAALDPSAPLAIDFSEFTLAVKNGDDARAIDLYGGPFLDGVHVDGSNSFEQWVSSERNRLSSLLSRAAEGRSRALLAHENWESAAEVSRKWLDADLSSSGAAKARLAAIAGPGTRESAVRALQEFERISSRLQSELGIRPETEVAALARSFSERIRQDEVPAGHTAEFAVPEMAPTVVASDASREVVAGSRRTSDTKPTPTAAYAVAPLATPAPSATAPTPRRTVAAKVAVIALVASLLIAIVAGLLYIDRNTPEARASTRTAIALTDFDFVGGDSTQRWMAEGLRTMLASRLSRSVAIELISPERVREISRRANYPVNELLGTERSREVGLQAGADWIVSGAVSRADTAYLLELTVRDVRTGRVLRVASVVSGNTLALTDAAAAKLLDVIDPVGSGAHLSELET
ncbi:MAG: BTAD domain-containing putative transcriptional regulator, partial [Gemmatimonas sp.]